MLKSVLKSKNGKLLFFLLLFRIEIAFSYLFQHSVRSILHFRYVLKALNHNTKNPFIYIYIYKISDLENLISIEDDMPQPIRFDRMHKCERQLEISHFETIF